MLKEKDKIFSNLYGFESPSLESAKKRDDWSNTKEIIQKGKVTSKLNNRGYKCYDTEDFQIGYKSFLTKTKPKFKNK